jgi:hypothetical protein
MRRQHRFVLLLGTLAFATAGTFAPFRFTAGPLTEPASANARDTVVGVFHAPFFAPSLYGDPTARIFGSGPSDGSWGVREYELDSMRLTRWWAAIALATIVGMVFSVPAPAVAIDAKLRHRMQAHDGAPHEATRREVRRR